MCAMNIHASELAMDFSQSFVNLRHRFSHAKVRSTTHLRGIADSQNAARDKQLGNTSGGQIGSDRSKVIFELRDANSEGCRSGPALTFDPKLFKRNMRGARDCYGTQFPSSFGQFLNVFNKFAFC